MSPIRNWGTMWGRMCFPCPPAAVPSLRETSIYCCERICSTSLRMMHASLSSASPPADQHALQAPAAGKCDEDQQNRVGNSHHQVNEPIHEMIPALGAEPPPPHNEGRLPAYRGATVPTMMLMRPINQQHHISLSQQIVPKGCSRLQPFLGKISLHQLIPQQDACQKIPGQNRRNHCSSSNGTGSPVDFGALCFMVEALPDLRIRNGTDDIGKQITHKHKHRAEQGDAQQKGNVRPHSAAAAAPRPG